MNNLKGKTLFITGASRGIGKAIALRAAVDGANIVIAAKTTEPHPKLPGTIYSASEEIEEHGGQALPLVVDIRFEDQVQAAVDKTVDTFGRHRYSNQQCQRDQFDWYTADGNEALRPDASNQLAGYVPMF